MVLAIVLGTLSGNDDVLLDGLGRFAEDAGFVRCVLLALGAMREPEDDDEVFDLGSRPWGEKGPGDLGITVRRAIDDAVVRNAIASRLESDAEEVRRAAAAALRHSLANADARRAFLSRLEREGDDDVAMVLGEALAVRAGDEAEPLARSEIVAALLRRAGEEGFDGYRFRMEDDFQRIALGPAERETLAELARGPHPFRVRSFAISALGAQAIRGGAEALDETRALLGACLDDDPEAAVRDLAARLLGKLPPDEGSLARLAQAASMDPAWRVRYAAVEALGAAGPGALEALRAASADPDERVAARARELTRQLEPR